MKIQLFGNDAKILTDCKSATFLVKHSNIEGHDVVELELIDASSRLPVLEAKK